MPESIYVDEHTHPASAYALNEDTNELKPLRDSYANMQEAMDDVVGVLKS